jgi:hypothetical protein
MHFGAYPGDKKRAGNHLIPAIRETNLLREITSFIS